MTVNDTLLPTLLIDADLARLCGRQRLAISARQLTSGSSSWLLAEDPVTQADASLLGQALASMFMATRPDLADLVRAAQAGDETAFAQAWHSLAHAPLTDEQYVRAARLALEAGAHSLARSISREGAGRHPGSEPLRRLSELLAPPRLIRDDLPPRPDIAANHQWIKEHRQVFRGSWVALREGQLLAAAKSLDELTQRVSDTKGVLLTAVF